MDDRARENKIREQEMLLESIYDTIEFGIIRYVVKNGNDCEILSMNQAALHMLDYETVQECVNDGFYGVASHVSDEDKPKILDRKSVV